MHFQTRATCYRLALLIFSIPLATAQNSKPEVPYVPTTDEGNRRGLPYTYGPQTYCGNRILVIILALGVYLQVRDKGTFCSRN
jgi:hypothetical protein